MSRPYRLSLRLRLLPPHDRGRSVLVSGFQHNVAHERFGAGWMKKAPDAGFAFYD
jgi:hypothetical protein